MPSFQKYAIGVYSIMTSNYISEVCAMNRCLISKMYYVCNGIIRFLVSKKITMIRHYQMSYFKTWIIIFYWRYQIYISNSVLWLVMTSYSQFQKGTIVCIEIIRLHFQQCPIVSNGIIFLVSKNTLWFLLKLSDYISNSALKLVMASYS